MTDNDFFAFEADGETYYVTANPTSPIENDLEQYGIQDQMQEMALVQMQKTRQLIRNCALQAVSAFRNFGAAEVQEVNLKFGVKLGGKAGIPYITEGSTESNLEISVKCTFPKQGTSDV